MRKFEYCVAAIATFTLVLAAPTAVRADADLSGVWVVVGGGGGGGDTFDPNPESEWSNEKLPFTPEGRAAFDANHPGKGPRRPHNPRERNDPLIEGNPPGLYRTLVYSRPIPDDLPTGPYWYGYSVGHWESDTLVVTTVAIDSRAWFDEWGTPITDDARVQERWRRVAPDALQLQITVTDPAFYAKPWKSIPIIMELRDEDVDLEEIIHAPIDEAEFQRPITDPAGGS